MNLKEIYGWFKIIAPPLLLLPLFVIPVDFMTMAFWAAGGIAFLVSVYRLAKDTVLTLRGKKGWDRRAIRRVLVIVIFLGAVFTVHASRVSADVYGKAVARVVQAQCQAKGVCPEGIDGWADPRVTRYGKYFTQYRIIYRLSEDKTEFTITVGHSIDEWLTVAGGVDRELKTTLTMDNQEFPED